LIVSLKQWDIEFVLGDATYDSEKVRQTAEQSGILFLSPIHCRNSGERKDAYGRVLPVFLKTRFGQWLFGLHCEIERGIVASLCITSSFYSSFATTSKKHFSSTAFFC
jgi:hypothetical protein